MQILKLKCKTWSLCTKTEKNSMCIACVAQCTMQKPCRGLAAENQQHLPRPKFLNTSAKFPKYLCQNSYSPLQLQNSGHTAFVAACTMYSHVETSDKIGQTIFDAGDQLFPKVGLY
mmetsp:Transcript_83962/g.145846  ORF Transcript_83962/g.145846 Transcript_83962/m.145846 type:complete len:116 (+) Transcript_83962:53-400(+)